MEETDSEVDQPNEVEESQELQRNPLANVIPKGYSKDDAQPSICLEDLEGENDVWILECPVTADPSLFLGKTISFSKKTTFRKDDESTEKYVSIPYKKSDHVCCLLSSRVQKSIKSVGLQHAGKIKVNTSYDVPELGSMLPDAPNIPMPEGLKVRHPFLGSNYEKIIIRMKNIKANMPVDAHQEEIHEISNNETSHEVLYPVDDMYHGHHRNKKKKDKICISEQSGEYLHHQESDEILLSPKMSRKRKRESSHYEVNDINLQEASEFTKDEHHSHRSKNMPDKDIIKPHKEAESRAAFDEVNISRLSPKKKRKKRESNCEESVLIVNEPQQDDFNLSEISKEIKIEKLSSPSKHNIHYRQSQEFVAIADSHVLMHKKSSKVIKMEKCPEEEKRFPAQNLECISVEERGFKKLKKRHTMNEADLAKISNFVGNLGQTSESKINGIPSDNNNKKYAGIVGSELSDIYLEKKQMENELSDSIKEKKKKKERRQTCLPEMTH